MKKEFVTLVEPMTYAPISKKMDRDTAHRTGTLHLVVHVWVMRGQNVIIQRRSSNKDRFPGLLDVSCAGHVRYGESMVDAVKREMQEELGIVVDTDRLPCHEFEFEDHFLGEGLDDKEAVFVYLYRLEDNEVITPGEELDGIVEISVDEFEDIFRPGESTLKPDDFVPHKGGYYEEVAGWLCIDTIAEELF